LHKFLYLFHVTNKNFFIFSVQLQIEEVTRRLRTGELGIPPNAEDRW